MACSRASLAVSCDKQQVWDCGSLDPEKQNIQCREKPYFTALTRSVDLALWLFSHLLFPTTPRASDCFTIRGAGLQPTHVSSPFSLPYGRFHVKDQVFFFLPCDSYCLARIRNWTPLALAPSRSFFLKKNVARIKLLQIIVCTSRINSAPQLGTLYLRILMCRNHLVLG